MSGISTGHSHPRPSSGKKTLKRCRKNKEADKVVLIDVDSEICDNVVIIDIPESLQKRNKESGMLKKDEKWSFRNVINIDDDETSIVGIILVQTMSVSPLAPLRVEDLFVLLRALQMTLMLLMKIANLSEIAKHQLGYQNASVHTPGKLPQVTTTMVRILTQSAIFLIYL